MLAKIFKLAFSLILLVTSGFANELGVVSLLKTENKLVKDPEDFCKLALQESLRYHLNSVAGELGAPEWVKPASKDFKTSVYNVIPSEIVRCMLDIKSYKHGSAEYGKFKIMEFLADDGFVGLDKYTEANWNYFLFMNCLNMMINCDFDASETSIDTVVDVIKDTDEQYSTYKGKLNAAASDIKIYMEGLNLYKYIEKLRSEFRQPKVQKLNYNKYPEDFVKKLPNISNASHKTNKEGKFNGGGFTVGSGDNALTFTIKQDGTVTSPLSDQGDGKIPNKPKQDTYTVSTTNQYIPGAPCGLKNMENTCYFNATMQFLYASEDFRNFVDKHKDKAAMAQILNKLFDNMKNLATWSPEETFSNIANIFSKKGLTLKGEVMRLGVQHDASELLGHLLNVINDQLKEDSSYKEAMEKYKQANSNIRQKFKYLQTTLEELCYHEQTTKLQGITCSHTSESSVRESLLRLEIPWCVNSCNFQRLVSAELSKEENLEGDNMWFCEECSGKVNAKKVTSIEGLPQTLIVHLKRFGGRWKDLKGDPLTNEEQGKIEACRHGTEVKHYITGGNVEREVKFDMSKICDPVAYESSLNIGGNTYHLRATIHHGGGLNGGHYWTNVYNQNGSLAYEANDDKITTASQSHSALDSQTVYLLMYEKVKLSDTQTQYHQ